MSAVDWSELPPELLETIVNNLKIHVDYIRFRAVCRDWKTSTPKTPKHLPCQLPWLMLPHRYGNGSHPSHLRGFFSLSDNKTHFLSLPEASHRRRCGSSHGWLAILEESPAIFLLNPLTRAKINLPPLSSFPNVVNFSFYDVGREYTLKTQEGDVYHCNLKEMRDSFIKKVIFSSSPSEDDPYFVALAILNQTGDVAYCKMGDQCWRFIDEAQNYYEDVIYHKGLFYAVNKSGRIAVCDVRGASPRVSFIDTPPQVGGDMQYLVSCRDGVFLVTRYLELEFDVDQHKLDILYKTTEFRVYRLDLSRPKWEIVTRLDDLALFVGENSSLAFCASDFPGCKGNCIYYTDDYSERNYDGANGDHDLGIYDLENGIAEDLPCFPLNSDSGCRWPPPIWVTPNPC